MKIDSARSPFVALEYRNFRLLWLGQLISVAGSQMQAVAINWHIWILTHSTLALGLTGLARFVPVVIFSLIGGIVADTRNRRQVMLVTQTAMLLAAAALGLFTDLGLVTPISIYLLSATTAAASAFDLPARQALVPNLVPREHLVNALTLNNIVFQVAAIVGPGLAGVLIAYIGVGSIYWINAASFLAVIVALLLMSSPEQVKSVINGSHAESLREGIKFVFSSRIILSSMLLDFVATFFSSANTLLPVFATSILGVGSVGFGILSASQSIGAVIAGAVVSWIGDMREKGAALLAGITVYGLATMLFGFSNSFVLSVVFLALVGAGDTLSTIMRNTIRQVLTPDYLRGRMTSINMIFFMGGPQLGEIEAGIVAAAFGAPFAVVSGGAATIIFVAITAFFVPALRSYRDI